MVETNATNTGQNIALTRDLLAAADVPAKTVLLISKPYMERRAFATCQKVWPEVRAICASEPIGLDDYLTSIGDTKLLIDMLVGDLQRVLESPPSALQSSKTSQPKSKLLTAAWSPLDTPAD